MDVDLKLKVFRPAKTLSMLDFRCICSWQYSTVCISGAWKYPATLKLLIEIETESVLSTVANKQDCVVACK